MDTCSANQLVSVYYLPIYYYYAIRFIIVFVTTVQNGKQRRARVYLYYTFSEWFIRSHSRDFVKYYSAYYYTLILPTFILYYVDRLVTFTRVSVTVYTLYSLSILQFDGRRRRRVCSSVSYLHRRPVISGMLNPCPVSILWRSLIAIGSVFCAEQSSFDIPSCMHDGQELFYAQYAYIRTS